DVQIAAVTRLPDAGGQDGDGWRAWSIVRRFERAAEPRALAEQLEERRGHVRGERAIGRAVVVAQHRRRRRVCRRTQIADAVAETFVLAIGERQVVALRVA